LPPVLGSDAGPVFLIVGAVNLIAQTGGGLYGVVPRPPSRQRRCDHRRLGDARGDSPL